MSTDYTIGESRIILYQFDIPDITAKTVLIEQERPALGPAQIQSSRQTCRPSADDDSIPVKHIFTPDNAYLVSDVRRHYILVLGYQLIPVFR